MIVFTRALQPVKTKEAEEHADQIDRIRTVLNGHLSNAAIRPLIKKFFHLKRDETSLAKAQLKIDYDQLLPLATMLHFPKDLLEADLKIIQTFLGKQKLDTGMPFKPQVSNSAVKERSEFKEGMSAERARI